MVAELQRDAQIIGISTNLFLYGRSPGNRMLIGIRGEEGRAGRMAQPLSPISLLGSLLALSEALELASPELSGHQLRTAFIVWELARASGLPDDETERLFIAALMHDIGALTPEEKIDLHRSEVEAPAGHCLLGEALFRSTPLLAPMAPVIRHHHQPWAEWGGVTQDPVARQAQILNLADVIERDVDRSQFILHQRAAITDRLRTAPKGLYRPDLVEAFRELAERDGFWLDLASPRLPFFLRQQAPGHERGLDRDGLAEVAVLFSLLIDFRSPFTATHSAGVAAVARELAGWDGTSSGVDPASIAIAGHLHDLGKMAVPTAILMKPAALTGAESAIMRQHPYHTLTVLRSINGMGRIPEWAALHHEKLDGSGYPLRLTADRIDHGTRIMTLADIYTALAEDRPYRPRMPTSSVTEILEYEARARRLDPGLTTSLLRRYDEIEGHMRAAQEQHRLRYDELRTLAGQTGSDAATRTCVIFTAPLPPRPGNT